MRVDVLDRDAAAADRGGGRGIRRGRRVPGIANERGFIFCGLIVIHSSVGASTLTPRISSAAMVRSTNGAETSEPVISSSIPRSSRAATSSRADANWLDSFPDTRPVRRGSGPSP